MKPGSTYYLRTETTVIGPDASEGHKVALEIPVGAIVTVIEIPVRASTDADHSMAGQGVLNVCQRFVGTGSRGEGHD